MRADGGFTFAVLPCQKRPTIRTHLTEKIVKPDEIKKLDAYFKRTSEPPDGRQGASAQE